MRRDYGSRDDYFDRFVPGEGEDGSWGFGKCDAPYGYSVGLLTDVDDTVLDDRGPAWNGGAGEPTGRTITPHYSFDEIEEDDWLIWVRKNGKVYVEALDPCPEE